MTNDDETRPHEPVADTTREQPSDQPRWQPPTWPSAVGPSAAGAPSWTPAPPTGPSSAPSEPPPGPGWSQPSWGPPAWPTQQSGQWTPPGAYYPGSSRYGSSAMAVVAGVVLLVMGVLTGLFGLLFLVVGAAGEQIMAEIDPGFPIAAGAFMAVLMVIAIVLIVFAAGQIVAAVGVFVHKSWARWTGIVVAVIGLVLGVLMLLGTLEGPVGGGDLVIVGIWLAAYITATVGLASGGEHFTPRYPGR